MNIIIIIMIIIYIYIYIYIYVCIHTHVHGFSGLEVILNGSYISPPASWPAAACRAGARINIQTKKFGVGAKSCFNAEGACSKCTA